MKFSPATIVIIVNAFFIGAVLMGFEMLGSRYLYPYFGGGIGTWAGLISTVLCALTIGYFVGGIIADKLASLKPLVLATAISGGYLALIPSSADNVIQGIMDIWGVGATGTLIASSVLILPPMACLGMFSPVATRMCVRSLEETGRISGLIYGISTVGSVFGTLFTTYVLVPELGSRMITYAFAGVLFVSSISFFLVSRTRRA